MSRLRVTRSLSLVLSLLLFSSQLSAAVFIVPSDQEMVQEADGIVIGTVTGLQPELTNEGEIHTLVSLTISGVLKGSFEERGRLVLREKGGELGNSAMLVSASPRYVPGERVLVFLERNQAGEWRTWGMLLGKFSAVTDRRGQRLLLREGSHGEVLGWDHAGERHLEKARSEQKFIRFIQDVVTRGESNVEPGVDERAEELELHATGLTVEPTGHYPPSAYLMGPMRWERFDNGGSVTFRVSGSQPGYDSTGAAQRGLAAWSNDPDSNISYQYGGTTSAGFGQDGANTIVFNASSGVPEGAIGYAQAWAGVQHNYKGETFYSIFEGDVIIRSGLTVSQKVFEEAVTHELGHTLAFRHSDAGTPSSTQAVMKATLSGNYGASLGTWDREAASHVYGSGSTSCTPPAITSQPQSTTISSGQSITLSVAVSGTSPFSYQWYVGQSGTTSSPISGATGSSYTAAPTATTSYWVRVSNACGAVNSTTATVTVSTTSTAFVDGDFNGDGRPDIVWRNQSSGENALWLMNGAQRQSIVYLPAVGDLNWQIAATGDFNRDGRTDLVWRNRATGENALWLMSGTTRGSIVYLQPVGDLNWHIQGSGDFNRDGSSDILWRNYASGENAIWLMNGSTRGSIVHLRAVGDLSWQIAGVADFNENGTADVLWRNYATGENAAWLMSGTSIVNIVYLSPVPDLNWRMVAVGNYDGARSADIVWRNYASGGNAMWWMSGTTIASIPALPSVEDLRWTIVGPR